MVSCYAQIINDYVLGYKIPELVKHEKIKARKLSYDSQVYLLMLGQFLHVFSLNELIDISKIYAKRTAKQPQGLAQIWAALLTHLVMRYINFKGIQGNRQSPSTHGFRKQPQ